MALLKEYLKEQAIHALEENVEKISWQSAWPVYEQYEILRDEAGKRYVWAPAARNGKVNRVKERSQPLSRASASLFLRFAHWVEDPGMDKELDTERNAAAAKLWAEKYGVLGLNSPDVSMRSLMNSTSVTAEHLGMPWLPDKPRGYRNEARGGRPQESVENFTFDAWEANIVLRLYESVRSQVVVDAPSVIRFMSSDEQVDLPESIMEARMKALREDLPNAERPSWVERNFYSQDPELTRMWALGIVDDAVNRKFWSYCHPIIQGAPGSYEPVWGFKSLLGAMWLQMMFLMRADRLCWYCHKPIDPGRRSHARFCDNNGKCRQKWNFHQGRGKSSKVAREQSRRVS
jgi:hypothetical protein